MKHILHYDAIVTNLEYYCQQCDDVDVVQCEHLRFLLQFIMNSADVTTTSISVIMTLPKLSVHNFCNQIIVYLSLQTSD